MLSGGAICTLTVVLGSQKAHCKSCPPLPDFKLASVFLKERTLLLCWFFFLSEYMHIYFENPDEKVDPGSA